MIWILSALALWTAASLVWFHTRFGAETGRDEWYDRLLYPPTYVIAIVVGLIFWRK